ncbi:MAG: Fe-S cluster assembly protein SufD [Micrococcales bacterium]|nr:Fe-S cluster assembly protein SufD [Micrococcales bacterium]NBR54465.1 Fe-S cluster assembly protein SufD [Micrococcales bacterium]NBR60363.1 Fe-S cluster assembly protein SufD [Actinomycetota bacterium]NBY44314.1 Fe-S cluster assembly protein SufD [Micrococcales bacterium]
MDQHGLNEHSHGASIPLQIRTDRPKSKSVSDFPQISKTQDLWKYLYVEQLKGLDSDVLAEYNQQISFSASPGVSVSWIPSTDARVGSIGLPEDRVAAAAYTNASQTLLVEIREDQTEPFYLNVAGDSTTASALHILVTVEKHVRATFVLKHTGLAVLGENVEILVKDEARLNFVSVQNWNEGSAHVSAHFAKLERNSFLKHTLATFGGDLVRITPVTSFSAPGAEVEMNGVYFANSGQHIENRPFVDHAAPNCKSRVTYKGALSGDKAHTVWIGDVLIRVVAEGTDTYELNRNLLLTDGARADSVPNLEIETGEILGAGHASASGRFDDEHLFYLQARGIPEDEARRLVVLGFLLEVLQRTEVSAEIDELTAVLESKLGAN